MPSGPNSRSSRKAGERAPGRARDQDAQQVAAHVVEPALARLVHQRQGAQAAHEFVRGGGLRRVRGAVAAEVTLANGALDRVGVGRRHDAAEAEAGGQQVAHRDRAPRGDRVVELRVDALQHPAVRQLRQPAIDRVVEPQHPVVDQEHGGGRGDRLGERGDPEDGVPPHRLAAAGGRRPDRVDEDLVPARDERDDPRNVAARDETGHCGVKRFGVHRFTVPAERVARVVGGAHRPRTLRGHRDERESLRSQTARAPSRSTSRSCAPSCDSGSSSSRTPSSQKPDPTWAPRSWFATSDRWGARA